MDIEIIPERITHWAWDEDEAKRCAREERVISRLAELPVVLALASALAIGRREAATIVRNRALARGNSVAA